ncbi:hypothetical protein TrVFT333_009141 [Trichoderma virens FT-333]|nr:hypothetical protein TrVFT333_009141 [Trichoderma virens FT-333]
MSRVANVIRVMLEMSQDTVRLEDAKVAGWRFGGGILAPSHSATAHRPEPTTPTNLVREKFDIPNTRASAPEAHHPSNLGVNLGSTPARLPPFLSIPPHRPSKDERSSERRAFPGGADRCSGHSENRQTLLVYLPDRGHRLPRGNGPERNPGDHQHLCLPHRRQLLSRHPPERCHERRRRRPRAKSNIAYQGEMIRHLKEVNVDANNVGWYTSATMGNFVNLAFIENQFHYQKDNDKTIALVYDTSRSSQGTLALKAYRLTNLFMNVYKEGKFTTESLQKSKLSFRDILQEYPLTVYNSHLLTSFLHQLPSPPAGAEAKEPSLSELNNDRIKAPLYPSIDNLDLSVDPFLEKTCDLLLESIESHYVDLNNFQFYQRQLAREQTKITQWQAKRKAENAQRTLAKQPLLPEDEWQRLFKLPQEPSRLEGMLNAKQVEQYSKQVDGFTANISAKMFAVRENLLPQ